MTLGCAVMSANRHARERLACQHTCEYTQSETFGESSRLSTVKQFFVIVQERLSTDTQAMPCKADVYQSFLGFLDFDLIIIMIMMNYLLL